MSDANCIATLSLNKPITSMASEHWVVNLEEDSEDKPTSTTESSHIPLHEGSILRIGRASANDIVIRNKLASRFHAIISVTRNAVIVCDLDSLNGSFVNGYRLDAPQDISNGDTLRIGPVELSVSMQLSRSSRPEGVTPSGSELQQVEVVLLLADLCSYRDKLESSSPEALTPLIQQWFASAREVINENEGEIDRFLGDGIIAYWTDVDTDPSDILNKGLKAAKQLQVRTAQLQKDSGEDSPWNCTVSLVSRSAFLVKTPDKKPSLVLGSVLNELFAINTFSKRKDVLFSCNKVAAGFIKGETRELDQIHSSAIEGEVVFPFEIVIND